jgi:hypothetical protein
MAVDYGSFHRVEELALSEGKEFSWLWIARRQPSWRAEGGATDVR